jgi:hypothetical protein
MSCKLRDRRDSRRDVIGLRGTTGCENANRSPEGVLEAGFDEIKTGQ